MADNEQPIVKSEIQKKSERIKALEDKLISLGVVGEAKLYYSLNKNMSDIADVLDNTDMAEINLSDPKDKTMERLKTIWAAITPLADTLKLLKMSAKITGDEDSDVIRKSFVDKIAEPRS